MELSELKPGITITGPKWLESVHIKKVENTGDYIHIVGSTILSNEHIDQIIPLPLSYATSPRCLKENYIDIFRIFLQFFEFHIFRYKNMLSDSYVH